MGNLSDYCKRCGSNRIPCDCKRRREDEEARKHQSEVLEQLAADVTDAIELRKQLAAAQSAREQAARERDEAVKRAEMAEEELANVRNEWLPVFAQLDPLWGPDPDVHLVDINVSEPGDYALVVAELVDMFRRSDQAATDARMKAAKFKSALARAREVVEGLARFTEYTEGLVDSWTQDDPNPEEELTALQDGAAEMSQLARQFLEDER